jgi:hypothetical protein
MAITRDTNSADMAVDMAAAMVEVTAAAMVAAAATELCRH